MIHQPANSNNFGSCNLMFVRLIRFQLFLWRLQYQSFCWIDWFLLSLICSKTRLLFFSMSKKIISLADFQQKTKGEVFFHKSSSKRLVPCIILEPLVDLVPFSFVPGVTFKLDDWATGPLELQVSYNKLGLVVENRLSLIAVICAAGTILFREIRSLVDWSRSLLWWCSLPHAPAVEGMHAEIMNQIKYLDDTFDYAPSPERSSDFGW